MRILQVVHGFPPKEWAGTELATFYLSQALRARGHQVMVLTRVGDPGAEEFSVREEQMDGLEVVRVVNNYSKTSTFRLVYDSSFFDLAFLRLLDRLRPDVVHFQHLCHLSVSLLPLAVALGYPTVLSLHDFFFPCHRIQLIDADDHLCAGPERGERCVPCLQEFATPEEVRHRFTYMEQTLRAPDVVLTPSVFLAEKICGYFPFLEGKLRAVPLGVKRVPRVAQERPVGAPLRILYVGVLLPHKGAHVLIEALKGLPADSVEVSLYGTVVPARQFYVDRLRKEAKNLSVQFYAPYPHEQLASILSRHDVLVMPMVWEETFSILTREALLAGLPVIAARRGALPEAVQDGVNGLLFEPENAADLRRCLTQLIAEPGLVERLRPINPQVKTMDEYARDIEELYTEICAEPYRMHALQQRLVTQYLIDIALQQETERLRAEIRDLSAQYAFVQAQRDQLSREKVLTEQEHDRALQERDRTEQERDRALQERDRTEQERDRALQERDRTEQERDRALQERDRTEQERDRALQERDRALATAQELEDILDKREDQLLERNARLEAIYTSTTWKLYRGYAALVHYLFHRPLGVLRYWLTS